METPKLNDVRNHNVGESDYSKHRIQPITCTRLKELLNYDALTGKFYHKTNQGKARVGDEAGTINKKGYLIIGLDGMSYRAHRLAWLFYYGFLPDKQIDHIDHNKLNNAIVNLRIVSNQENHKNMPLQKNNKSGCAGVGWQESTNKWRAYIKVKGKSIHLGLFDTKEEAIKRRRHAEYVLGFHTNHGKNISNYNIGASDYARHLIQPWQIWIEYKLNPFDADIIKRVLRHKKTDSRRMDYEKIVHICQERIRQIDNNEDVWEEK